MKQTKNIYAAVLMLAFVSCENKSGKDGPPKGPSPIITKKPAQDTGLTANSKKHQAENKTIDNLPAVLKTFIPAGYSALTISSGDANLDGLTDKILVLRKNTEGTTSSFGENQSDRRPLLLLLGQADSTYKVGYRNDNAVYCIDCGGAFGDPFTGTAIKNGYFSVEHGIAGGMHWEMVTTFKFDKLKKNWFLYKSHYISYRLHENGDKSEDALIKETDKLETVKDFGTVSFEQFSIYSNTKKRLTGK